MSQFKVRLRGKLVYQIDLAEERTYIAGRKEDCDIVLSPEKGISREHFKLNFIDGVWSVDVISRYGEILVHGERQQSLQLTEDVQFAIGVYDFEFLLRSSYNQPNPEGSFLPIAREGNSVAMDGNEEKTVVGAAPLVAFVRVMTKEQREIDCVRLDAGDSWVAGRDSSCQIQIQDQRMSRKQFEIRRVGSQYFIIDLGSVNGTLVNGDVVSSTDPILLKSGDLVTALDNIFQFELHDANYESRLKLLPAAGSNYLVPTSSDILPVEYQRQSHQDIVPYTDHYPAAIANSMPQSHFPSAGPVKKKPDKLFLILVAAIVVIGAFLFSGEDSGTSKKANTVGAPPGSAKEAFLKLSPEQQTIVKRRYTDARNFLMQGKYQLAQEEVLKIQELVKDYEDIKEIERWAKEAIASQEATRRLEQLEKEKAETEAKIQAQADICQKKINRAITMTELEDCLSPIMQFDPSHPRVLDLHRQVEGIVAAKEAEAAKKLAYQGLLDKMRGIYLKAEKVHNTGKPLDAIAAYENVIATNLPDPQGYKDKSRVAIVQIKKMMNSKTAVFQEQAQKYYEARNLKDAILSLRKARALDPSNFEIPDRIERYTTELRKKMMEYYQEGILEESFGNIGTNDGAADGKEGAKDKWKKILEYDLPDGEYYKKAYIKLKKYGAL